MTSLNCAQKIFVRIPKHLVATNVNPISSRTIRIPARYELLKQAASERLLLNWFNEAWGKTKNAILDNWESAGLKKSRKPVDKDRKSGNVSRYSRTDKSVSPNKPQDFAAKTPKNVLDKVKENVTSSVDELAKAKNKSQRQLAENWDTIRQANSKKTKNLTDDIRKSATSTVDEVSKSVKEKGILNAVIAWVSSAFYDKFLF